MKKKSVLFVMLTMMCLFTMAQVKETVELQRPHVELIVQDSMHQLVISAQEVEVLQDSLQTINAKSQTLKEFKELILGGLKAVDYYAAFVFAFIGMLIRWFITTRKGVKTSSDTPNKFNLWFWLRDNAKDKLLTIAGTIAVIFVFMRFPYDLAGWEFSMFFAFIVGLFLDYFIDLLEKLKPERKPINASPNNI